MNVSNYPDGCDDPIMVAAAAAGVPSEELGAYGVYPQTFHSWNAYHDLRAKFEAERAAKRVSAEEVNSVPDDDVVSLGKDGTTQDELDEEAAKEEEDDAEDSDGKNSSLRSFFESFMQVLAGYAAENGWLPPESRPVRSRRRRMRRPESPPHDTALSRMQELAEAAEEAGRPLPSPDGMTRKPLEPQVVSLVPKQTKAERKRLMLAWLDAILEGFGWRPAVVDVASLQDRGTDISHEHSARMPGHDAVSTQPEIEATTPQPPPAEAGIHDQKFDDEGVGMEMDVTTPPPSPAKEGTSEQVSLDEGRGPETQATSVPRLPTEVDANEQPFFYEGLGPEMQEEAVDTARVKTAAVEKANPSRIVSAGEQAINGAPDTTAKKAEGIAGGAASRNLSPRDNPDSSTVATTQAVAVATQPGSSGSHSPYASEEPTSTNVPPSSAEIANDPSLYSQRADLATTDKSTLPDSAFTIDSAKPASTPRAAAAPRPNGGLAGRRPGVRGSKPSLKTRFRQTIEVAPAYQITSASSSCSGSQGGRTGTFATGSAAEPTGLTGDGVKSIGNLTTSGALQSI